MMKCFTLIALAVLFITALGAGSAFAETYQVTAGYGVRVIEQGSCEQVGSITLEGQTGADLFVNGTTITVELLGGAIICRNVGASYTFGGPGVIPNAINTWDPSTTAPVLGSVEEYYIEAVAGDDYFVIEIVATSVPADRVIVGHELESYLCFNLQGTIYNPNDPNLQLVQVSYRDSDENTYSGDSYVATVKPQTISFGICQTGKADVESRAFCYIPESASQTNPDPDQCGYEYWSSACLFRFTDNSVGELDGTYQMTIGKTSGAKAGIGFQTIMIYYDTGGYGVPVVVTERQNTANVVLNPADYGGVGQPPIEAMYAETSQITVEADLDGPGTYFVYGTGYALHGLGAICSFEIGDWVVDISGSKIPCGHSFSDLERLILHTFECSYYYYCMIFPFAAGSWMNGLVLDNPNSHDQTYTAYIYEADGDMYVAQGTVAAHSMAVDLVENIFTVTVPDATDAAPFDEDYWLRIVTDDDPWYGYMFIFDGTMANGYTPICCYPECYD